LDVTDWYDGLTVTVDRGPFAALRAAEQARMELGPHVEVMGQCGWDPIADTVSFIIEEET
jgi:hypothetical protein